MTASLASAHDPIVILTMPSCAPRPFLPYHTHARTEPLRALARAAILFPFLFMEEAFSQSIRKQMRKLARLGSTFDAPLRFPPCKAREPVRPPVSQGKAKGRA